MFDRATFANTCPQRANIIEWLPFKKGQSVVIPSSAPEGMLQMLREKEVQLQVMSEAHVEKLAMNPGKGSLDFIVLPGMEVNAAMLSGLSKKLKPEGRLVVLLHNKYGMSYLAGKPPYGQEYYAEVEGRTSDKTAFYSANGLAKLVEDAGLSDCCMRYYADPDGEFAVNIYSDAYLPKAGDCNLKPRNFTYDRFAMFREAEALGASVQEGMFHIFANDYLLVTGEPLPQRMIRYSNDRAAAYQIRTEITDNHVRKTPLKPEGAARVKGMTDTYKALISQYSEDAFVIVPCAWNGTYTAFPFVKGVTLAELMKEALEQEDLNRIFTLFHTFLNKLKSSKGGRFANYDFIFSNIIIDGDAWQVVDYEWTLNQAVPAEELAFRAAYCFSLEHPYFPLQDICQILDLDEKAVKGLIEKETAYQHAITDGALSLESLCAAEGGDVYTGAQAFRALELCVPDHTAQIYEDSGKGFSEEMSYFVQHAMIRADEMELTLQVAAGMKALRIDPCDEPCLLQIKRIWWNGKEASLDKYITTNGVKGKAGKEGYAECVFATKDPNFTISLEKLENKEFGKNELRLQLELHTLSLQLANALTKSIKRLI